MGRTRSASPDAPLVLIEPLASQPSSMGVPNFSITLGFDCAFASACRATSECLIAPVTMRKIARNRTKRPTTRVGKNHFRFSDHQLFGGAGAEDKDATKGDPHAVH